MFLLKLLSLELKMVKEGLLDQSQAVDCMGLGYNLEVFKPYLSKPVKKLGVKQDLDGQVYIYGELAKLYYIVHKTKLNDLILGLGKKVIPMSFVYTKTLKLKYKDLIYIELLENKLDQLNGVKSSIYKEN